MVPELTGKHNQQQKHDYLYWEFFEQGGRQSVRMGFWKGIRQDMTQNPDAAVKLYHLPDDTEEQNNVADSHPDIIEKIIKIMEEARTPSDYFKFNFEK